MKFTNTEKEVIFLKAIKELIDSMVNYEVLNVLGDDPHSEVHFKSMTHQKYFNIILLDFLSCSDKKVLGEQQSYLGAIRAICQSPNFNKNNSMKNLTISTQEFVDWLEQEVQVDIWLPAIDTETDLSIKRIEFIKICGNISKHNFSRLSGVANELIAIFKRLDSHKFYIRQPSCEGLCVCVVFAFLELTALSSLFRNRINCF